ncbi:MAG: sugar-binding protein, partial [Planctomycetota bacterium]|nr:sugar-binding protein [Planctomycetota bacterium]
SKALAGTNGILSNEMQKVSEAFGKNDAAAVAARSSEATRAIGGLIKNLEEARGELGSELGTLNPSAEKNVAAAGKALQEAGKGVENADKRLKEAAHQAQVAAENEIGKAVTGTQKKLQNAVRASLEDSAGALDQEPESEKGTPKSSFSAPPDALAKQRIDGKLEAAQEHSGQAEKDLAEIESEISDHRQKLASAGKTFAKRASTAVAGATASGSAARKEADAFLDKTLREKVAEQFRKRTEGLAAAALKQKKIADDPSFAKKVGQMAVDTLLKGSPGALKKGSFDALSAKTAQAFGGEGAHGGAKNGAAGQGSQQNGADANLEEAVSKGLADQAKAGISSALAASQKHLKLPSAGAFGGESQIGFKLRNAMENVGRPVEGNSTDATLIDLSRDLKTIGLARKSGTRRLTLFKGRENIEKRYRERMAEVIEDREIDELILNAPQQANEVSTSQAQMGKKRNAFILVSQEKEETDLDGEETEEETPERKLYQPRFKTFAYGGAPLALDPPTIDGDLADWESIEEFKLKGVRKKAYWPGKVPPAWENNRYMMVQWNQKGFYFACRVVDRRNNIAAGTGDFWDNDSVEVFFDFANKRPEMRTKETQQFWFWPLGSRLGPKALGGEASLQFSGRIFKAGNNPRQPRMAVKQTQNPRGYHVEIFLPVEVFRKPDLKPGRIIAFNFSINNGENLFFRWTANLGRNISVTPSLWGDLALLGTDAEIAFVKPGTEKPLTVIVPGEPVGAHIKDVDMNLDRKKKDKIEVAFSTENGDALTGFFEETGEDTGLFAGSIDTALLLLQGDSRFKDKVLQVTGGELVEIIYLDQARRYGERNFEVKQKLPVGLPMLQL